MKCPKCNGTGKPGTFTVHTCYKCSGSGSVREKKVRKADRK